MLVICLWSDGLPVIMAIREMENLEGFFHLKIGGGSCIFSATV